MRFALALVLASVLGCTPDPEPATTWAAVIRGLPSGLVSVSGRSARDVFVCGGDPGDGKGPYVLHFDGTSWKRLATGTTGDLWWVHVFPDGTALFAGDGGKILRYENGHFTAQVTPGTLTVYGVWGASKDDAWAVGGSPDDGTGFVWRWDGAAWKPFELPGHPEGHTTFYKVWGTSPTDVWLVGTAGRLLHTDGTTVTDENTDPKLTTSEKPLFTVHGAGTRVVAVGGFAGGFIVEHDATGTHNASPTGLLGLSGIVMTSADHGYAVGQKLSILERAAGGGWNRVDTKLTGSEDLHAAWVDPDGGVWAVGGDILSLPLSHGILVHSGPSISGTISD